MKSFKKRLEQTTQGIGRLHQDNPSALSNQAPAQVTGQSPTPALSQPAGQDLPPQSIDKDLDRDQDTNRPKTAPGKAVLWAVQGQQISKLEDRIKFLEAHSAGTAIDLTLLHPNPFQPRTDFDAANLEELVGSIRHHGLIQPIIVRQHPTLEGHYQIIAGERRFRAHQMLGAQTINTIVAQVDDGSLAEWALIENLARKDLSDYEAAKCILALRGRQIQSTELAEKLGISRAHLYRLYTYENLPQFVLDDLNERPAMLGSSAASELVSLLKNSPAAIDALKSVWPRFKRDEIKQNKLVAKVKQVMAGKPAIASRASTEFFVEGKRIGVMRFDSGGLRLILQPNALSDDLLAELNAVLVKAFPQAKALEADEESASEGLD